MSEESAVGRGRPRPDETVNRDKTVLTHLQTAGPQTRAQIAEATQLEGKFVYLSLYRLNKAGAIQRSGSTWTAVSGEVAAPVA